MDEIYLSIPQQVENLALPDPDLLTYYKNLENRSIWIEKEINNQTLEVIKKIIEWNKEDSLIPVEKRNPIKLFFFSPGGDLDINYALIDVINMSRTPIYGINMGKCCSAAAYIYLSCHKRMMLPHSYFVFHQGSSSLSGNYNEVVAIINDYQGQVEGLAALMKEKTQYSEEEITENIITEWYVRKDEALKKGVCHEVISDIDLLL